MDFKELKTKTEKELTELLAKNREQFRDLRFKVSAKQLKNVKEIDFVRKAIARILTLLKQRQIRPDEHSSNQETNLN